MGVPPEVQPTCLDKLHETLGYTQPRSQGLSSSLPLERERGETPQEERPWERGWVTLYSWVCHLKYRLPVKINYIKHWV